MGLRREGRELALQILYANDAGKQELRETLRGFRDGIETSQKVREFAEGLAQGVQEHRTEIDAAIKARSKNWSIRRMPKVDLNIMRMAAYELMFCPEIPRKVTINEAIEIAKIFGDKDSASFVNGILDDLEPCKKTEENSEN
jgi:transcription antitermination protein NusB